MSSVSLPALDIRTQQPSAFDELSRIFAIKNLSQQQQAGQLGLQQEQLEMADDAKWRSAMSRPDWDGSPEQFLKNGLKAGVGPQSYSKVAQGLAAVGEGYAKL